MWIGLVAVIALALFLVAGAIAARAAAERARRLPEVARRAGLEYREFDPFNSTAIAFPLFRAGDERVIEHVMWRGDGRVRVFDYGYAERSADHDRKTWHLFSCAMAQHDGRWPPIAVLPEGPLDRALQALSSGALDVEVESEEFNRTFSVRCTDRKFATDLLSPEMMELLLGTKGKLAFESRGRFLLVTGPRVDGHLLPGLLGVAERFLAAIPPVVPELYGTFPEGLGTDDMPIPPSRPDRERPLVQGGFFGDLDADEARREPFRFAPPPDLDPADAAWDPTPGVDHDLDGRPIPPAEEDPWGEGRPDR